MWPSLGEHITSIRISIVSLFVCIGLASPSFAYDVVISGGGPAGLAAGIFSRMSNLDTLIVEKRVPSPSNPLLLKKAPGILPFQHNTRSNHWGSRQRNIFLDTEAVTTLGQLTANDLQISAVTEFRFTTGLQNINNAVSLTAGRLTQFIQNTLFAGRSFKAVGSISEIENHLLNIFLELGGHISFGSEVTSQDLPSRTVQVNMNNHANSLTTQLFLVAEGDHSETRKNLGEVPTALTPFKRPAVVATFKVQKIHAPVTLEVKNNWSFPYSLIALSHLHTTTIYISPYDFNQTAGLLTPEKIALRAAANMGLEGSLIEANSFLSEPSSLPRFVLENYVVFLGDAAHKADPATGLGTSMALQDAKRLLSVFQTLSQHGRDSVLFPQALEQYQRATAAFDHIIADQSRRFKKDFERLAAPELQAGFIIGVPLAGIASRFLGSAFRTRPGAYAMPVGTLNSQLGWAQGCHQTLPRN